MHLDRIGGDAGDYPRCEQHPRREAFAAYSTDRRETVVRVFGLIGLVIEAVTGERYTDWIFEACFRR
jgi:hypothetical protein